MKMNSEFLNKVHAEALVPDPDRGLFDFISNFEQRFIKSRYFNICKNWTLIHFLLMHCS